jgi:hypothetical protein
MNTKTKQQFIMGAAVASMVGAFTLSAQASDTKNADHSYECKGQNSCGGKGGCAGKDGKGCATKNSCANHVFYTKDKAACDAKLKEQAAAAPKKG